MKFSRSAILLLTVSLGLASCGRDQPADTPAVAPAASPAMASPAAALPQRGTLEAITYAGDIPCADCPGQRVVLTLFPNFTFRLRRTYREATKGQDASFYDMGRWARAQDSGDRLRLNGGTEAPQQFRYVAPDRIRMLNNEGNEIQTTLNYDLTRQPAVDPVAGPMRLRGMYVYMADAASVTECLTGQIYPIPPEADSAAIERAYLQARSQPGQPVLATFEGRFVERAPEPGARMREHVIVERFERFSPGESCASPSRPPAQRAASLIETTWQAVEIDGQRVNAQEGRRAPELVLSAEGNRVSGFTGCNQFTGGFEQGSDGFRFTRVAMTRMACLPPAGEIEAPFTAALNATASQRIAGKTLELRDASGTVRMRLEARPR